MLATPTAFDAFVFLRNGNTTVQMDGRISTEVMNRKKLNCVVNNPVRKKRYWKISPNTNTIIHDAKRSKDYGSLR